MIRLLSVIIVAACLGAGALGGMATAFAQSSGLPLPRFVSLRSDQVNMRSGPGVRYPVDWVYLRRNLPVEVIAEFDTWRKIRDPDGAEGWVHQSMLAGRRTVIVSTPRAPLRRTADDEGMPAALIEAGAVGRLVQCPTGSIFCRVEISGFQGWLKREEFWGVYRMEFVE